MFKFRSVIHFELIFVKGVRFVTRFISFFACAVVTALFVEKMIFAPLYCLCYFVKDKLTVFIWVYFWVLYSVPLIYLSILSPIPHCLDYCSFVVSLEVGSVSLQLCSSSILCWLFWVFFFSI